jgi:hypothetical protein
MSEKSLHTLTVEAIALCVRAHGDLRSAWEIIQRDENSDSSQKREGIEYAISFGWATAEEWAAIP